MTFLQRLSMILALMPQRAIHHPPCDQKTRRSCADDDIVVVINKGRQKKSVETYTSVSDCDIKVEQTR
jgi:hypothetical protein